MIILWELLRHRTLAHTRWDSRILVGLVVLLEEVDTSVMFRSYTRFYCCSHYDDCFYIFLSQMAMWNLLGERPVDACYWESFGKGWKEDTVKHLGLKNTRDFTADYGMLPDLEKTNPDHDILFTFNGTTSGVRVPNLDWISDNRQVRNHPIDAS